MFSAAYDKLLTIYLSKIVSSLDKQQVEIQIKNGHAELENLNINPIFLIKIKLPILIQKSIINKMTIDISDETKTLLISISDCYLLTKQNELNSNEFQTNFFRIFELPKIVKMFTSKLDNVPLNIFNQIIIKIDQIQILYAQNNFSIKTILSSFNYNLTEQSLNIPSISSHFYRPNSINFELDLVNLMNSIESEVLSIENFSINLKTELNSIQIQTDPIQIKIQNKELLFKSNSIDIENIFLKLFDLINNEKIFNVQNALDFLNNRESFFKEIQSTSNSNIYDRSNCCVKNDLIEYANFKLDLIEKFNVNLVIPSISINLDQNVLNLNQIKIQDQKLTINDISMNERKISVTKPFISTQIVNHQENFTFSKLEFIIKKSDDNYVIIKFLLEILSVFSLHKSVLNFQEIRARIENPNDDVNEFIINSMQFDFQSKTGYIDIQGGNIDQKSSFSPYKLKILQTPITNSIVFQADSLELKFQTHELFLSKKNDIQQLMKKICEQFQISFRIDSLQIHNKQFSIQISNYKVNSDSESYQKIEFFDQALKFVSFDFCSIKNNCIEFNNLSVYLADSQMKFLLSFGKYDKFIANHFSIQLPDSDFFISIDKIEFNELVHITNWSVKSKNEYVIKPLTFSVKYQKDQIETEIDKVEIEIEKDQFQKLIDLLCVIFKNQIFNILIKFNSILIKLKSNESIIGQFVINSIEFKKLLEDHSIAFKAQNIIDLQTDFGKSIEIKNPFEFQLKPIERSFYEISMNLTGLSLSFSPSLFSFCLCIFKSRSFLCQYNITINNSIISFYNSKNAFEKIQFDQLSLISKDPENFTFSMKNIQFCELSLPSIEFSVVDSVFNYSNNSKLEINMNSNLFNEILEFYKYLSINSTMFISIGQNISLNSIQINLTDLSQSILIENIKSKVNLKRGILSISKISLTKIFELTDLNFFFEFTNHETELNLDDFNNLNSIGDVFNPTSFSSIQLKLEINKIDLNTFDFDLTKKLFDCYFSPKFVLLKQFIEIKNVQINNQFNDQSFQINFKDLSLNICKGKFELISNDLQIEPNQLITKQTTENLVTAIKNDSEISIQIAPCIFKFDFNLLYFFTKIFDHFEKITLSFQKLNLIIQTEFESPLNLLLDCKLKKKFDTKTLKAFIHSIYFLEEKPIIQNTSIKLQIDHEFNFLINISNTVIYVTSYLQTIVNDFLTKSFNFLNMKEITIKSISLNFGDLSIVICPMSFQPKFRLNFSAFSTQIKFNESSQFVIRSCIEFLNDRIYDWDYLVEPFSIDVSVFLNKSIDFKLKVQKELNINLSEFKSQPIDDQIEPYLEKFKQTNKIYELPLFFIKNNLDISVSIKIDDVFFILESQQILPVFLNAFPKLFELTLDDQTIQFTMEDIIYPIIFSTRLSVVKKFNCIELNSPVHITSLIRNQCIYLYEKQNDNFVFDIALETFQCYPLYFDSNKPKDILLLLNNKNNFEKTEIVSISPFNDQNELTEHISIEHGQYSLLIKKENDKSGKIIKLYSAMICENLLPAAIFIKHNNNVVIANKNSIVDLLFISSELGSTIQFELSMNGVDYSIPNKVKVELFNDTLKNLSIFDCRIQKEIVINAKFIQLPNGQIKMVLLSPIVFSNLTENVFYIGNNIISMYDWSIFNPFNLNQEQLQIESSRFQPFCIDYTKNQTQILFLKKENKLSRKSDASDVKTSFHSLKHLFKSRYTTSEDNDITDNSVEPSNLRFQNYFIPLCVQTKYQSFTVCTISYLVQIYNNLDIPIECDFLIIQPHQNEKIKAIKLENFLCIKIMNEEKKFPLDLLGKKFTRIGFVIHEEKFILEINHEEYCYTLTISKALISPIYITNQIDSDLISNNELPINVSVYQSNPNKSIVLNMNSSTPFYFNDFGSFCLNIRFESADSTVFWSKIFTISIESETSPVEILKSYNDISFHVTIRKYKNIELIHLVSKKYHYEPNPFFRWSFEVFIPTLYVSIIDNKMNEALLITTNDLCLFIDHQIDSDPNSFYQSKLFKVQLKSLQLDSQFVDDQFSILGINDVLIQLYLNEYTKFCKVQVNNIVELCLDSAYLEAIKSFLDKHIKKLEKFDWFQISPISLNLTYIDKNIHNESQRRRSSFMNFDSQNVHQFDLIQIPGMVFGQFDGDYLLSIAKEYIDNFIKPKVQSFTSLEIDLNLPVVTKRTDLDNRHIIFDVINKSSLIFLALCLTKNNIEVPLQLANVLGSLPSYSKIISPFANGFILHYNDANCATSNVNILENRLPRCFPQFRIGKYNQEESQVFLLIRNRFRMKEGVRFVAKNTLTNDLVALTDRFLIIINPTIDYIVDEISFLDITSVVVLQNEIRISGRKKNEKLTFRFNNEQITMRFNVFIASQKISLAMFGMSMIDK